MGLAAEAVQENLSLGENEMVVVAEEAEPLPGRVSQPMRCLPPLMLLSVLVRLAGRLRLMILALTVQGEGIQKFMSPLD